MNARADVVPATVSIAPTGSDIEPFNLRSAPPTHGSYPITIARVVIMNNRIIIAQDSGNGPQVVFSEGIDPLTYYKNPDKDRDSFVQTLSGKKIAFKKDSACGCGSRLRSWNPYGSGVSSIKDPS